MNTRASEEQPAYILEGIPARASSLWPPCRTRSVEDVEIEELEIVVVQDTGEPDDPYEEFLASALPDLIDNLARSSRTSRSQSTTRRARPASPGGPFYTHRGAYLRALGVALETKLSYDSVHLWTLPMFHCDGWCLTWGVTAAGATHVCLRRVEPERIWQLFESEGVTHYSGAPTIHICIVKPRERAPARAARHGADRRLAAVADAAREDARAQPAPDPPRRADRDLGPVMGCSWQPQWDELEIDEQAKLLARQGHT